MYNGIKKDTIFFCGIFKDSIFASSNNQTLNDPTKKVILILIVNSTNALKFTVMARNYETALAELNSSNAELAEIEAMTDEKACYIYNVDSKSEIVKIISEDIEALEREVEYLTPEVYEPEYDY